MKEMISKVGGALSKATGRTGLLIQKNSPEILLGVGLVTFVGTVVLACRATLKAEEVLDAHNEGMEKINKARELVVEAEEKGENVYVDYTEHDMQKDKFALSVKSCVNLAKLYGPAIAMGVVSVGCIIKSNSILKGRYVGAVAAYESLRMTFDAYRRRNLERNGEGNDEFCMYGVDYNTSVDVVKTEDGKKEKITTVNEMFDTSKMNLEGAMCRVFDHTNANWDHNPSFCLSFLTGQQRYLNELLHNRGHLFLNEVLDQLGFSHTPEGACLGWIADDNVDLDFGLYKYDREHVRRFINGQDDAILIEFNVTGVIWDKI